MKLQVEASNFIHKETQTQVFSCEFCEISNNIFFTEHLWVTFDSVLNTLSEYTCFYIPENITSYMLCLFLRSSKVFSVSLNV